MGREVVELRFHVERAGHLSSANIRYLEGGLLSGEMGAIAETASGSVKVRVREAFFLVAAEHAESFRLLDARLDKMDASLALKRSASRHETPEGTVYDIIKGIERGVEIADPGLLEKTGNKEDRRRPA